MTEEHQHRTFIYFRNVYQEPSYSGSMCWEIDLPIAGILPQATTGIGRVNEDMLRELYAADEGISEHWR